MRDILFFSLIGAYLTIVSIMAYVTLISVGITDVIAAVIASLIAYLSLNTLVYVYVRDVSPGG